jgi:hypothetical protein
MVPWIRIHRSARADMGCGTGHARATVAERHALAKGEGGKDGREGGEAGENEKRVGGREPDCSI